MALDKETLLEIKAYMDERGEVWRHEATSAAQVTMTDKLDRQFTQETSRLRNYGAIGVALLITVAGFTYTSILSFAESAAKDRAEEVLQQQLIVDAARLEERMAERNEQRQFVVQLAQAKGQAQAAIEDVSRVVSEAQDSQRIFEEEVETARASSARAKATVSSLEAFSRQIQERSDELGSVLSDAADQREKFEALRTEFVRAQSLVDEIRASLDSFRKEDGPVAELAKNIVNDPQLAASILAQTGFPSGAVVAFDSRMGCPSDWTFYAEAQGRTLIGAVISGVNPNVDVNGVRLSSIKLLERGGEENVTLAPAQMPRHNHRISTGFSDNWGHDGLSTQAGSAYGIDWVFNNPDPSIKRTGGFGAVPHALEETGQNQPHNNMPPYIALYFCKKD